MQLICLFSLTIDNKRGSKRFESKAGLRQPDKQNKTYRRFTSKRNKLWTDPSYENISFSDCFII